MKPYNLSTVDAFKDLTGIGTNAYNRHISQFIERSSVLMEQYTGRKLRARIYGENGIPAEIQNGAGNNSLYTRQFSIISIQGVYIDSNSLFPESTLVPAGDYRYISDIGKIYLLPSATAHTIFPSGIANVQLKYTAGYGTFLIGNFNHSFDIEISDVSYSITIDSGEYSGGELAALLESGLNLIDGITNIFSVSYVDSSGWFKIACDSEFKILWESGVNADNNIGNTIGFDTIEDSDELLIHTSNFGVLGIPADLEQACLSIALRMWENSNLGSNRFDIEFKNIKDTAGTIKFRGGNIPEDAAAILNLYTRQGNY